MALEAPIIHRISRHETSNINIILRIFSIKLTILKISKNKKKSIICYQKFILEVRLCWSIPVPELEERIVVGVLLVTVACCHTHRK